MEGVSRFCFEASYALALAMELLALVRPIRIVRAIGVARGLAGLIAHTAFLIVHRPTMHTPYGSLLLLAWVLAVFGIYGAVHHRQLAWSIFVLPLVLALVVLAGIYAPGADSGEPPAFLSRLTGEQFWGAVHGGLLLLAAVGVSVGFVASVMYLTQAHRLRSKTSPHRGVQLWSLERLEAMNRRAVNLAFPLLTVGVLLGAALMTQRQRAASEWSAAKFVGTYGLWVVVAVLLYQPYGVRARGRHLAVVTIGAFVVLIAVLAAGHPILEVPP